MKEYFSDFVQLSAGDDVRVIAGTQKLYRTAVVVAPAYGGAQGMVRVLGEPLRVGNNHGASVGGGGDNDDEGRGLRQAHGDEFEDDHEYDDDDAHGALGAEHPATADAGVVICVDRGAVFLVGDAPVTTYFLNTTKLDAANQFARALVTEIER